MAREACLRKCSDWKRCMVDRLCCCGQIHATPPSGDAPTIDNANASSAGARGDPPTCENVNATSASAPVDPSPENANASSASVPGDQSPPAFRDEKINREDLNELVEYVKQVCERLDQTSSSNISGSWSRWIKYKERATSLMHEVENLPEEFTDEVTAVGKSLLLPLLRKALGGVGQLHWITVGFSLIGWSLESLEKMKKNREACSDLLRRATRLLINVKDIWEATTSEDRVKDLQDSVEKAMRCAIICSSEMGSWRLFRYLKATTTEGSIDDLRRDLDTALQQNINVAVTDLLLYDRRKQLVRQYTYAPSDGIVGGDNEVTQNAMEYLNRNRDCSEMLAVCLHGMGGIGKSTIGDTIFLKFKGKKSGQPPMYQCCRVELPLEIEAQGLRIFQKQILDLLYKESQPEILNLLDGRNKLKERLEDIRDPVFLYIDNVSEQSQLTELLPYASCFPKRSRILVTTRDENVRNGIRALKIQDCKLIEVEKLNERLAKELLWRQLEPLKEDAQSSAIKDLQTKLLKMCDGLPLALTLVGQFIANDEEGPSNEKVWKEAIEAMRAAEPLDGGAKDGLYSRLKFSINGLDSATKRAFLDVVAFLVGWQWERAEYVANSWRLKNLLKRALVERRENLDHGGKYLGVHDVLKAMGLQMVAEDEQEIRVTRKAAWRKISQSALEKVVGLQRVTVEAAQLQLMPRLRILNRVHIKGGCQAAKLTHLSLLHVKSFTSWPPFDISACTALKALILEDKTNTLDFDLEVLRCEIPLEMLLISGCRELLNVDAIIYLSSLKVLFLNCSRLEALPEGVAGLTGLTSLDLSQCESLQVLPEGVAGLTGLTSLGLSRCKSLQALPEGVAGLTGLTSLDLSRCKSLQALPEGVAGLTGLMSLNLRRCKSLQALPEGVAGLTSLTSLDLSWCKSLQALPEGVVGLMSLTSLGLSRCKSLQMLPEGVAGLTGLTSLDLSRCQSLQALPEGVACLTGLTSLDLQDCKSLQALSEGVVGLTGLTSLNLSQCKSLQALPEGVAGLTGLTSLDLSRCESLQALSEGVAGLTGLTSLGLSRCESLQALPEGVAGLTGLTSLDLSRCKSLQALPEGVAGLTGLTSLNLSRCESLQALPEGVASLTGLTSLDLSWCKSLQALPEGVAALTGLTSLDLSRCKSLQALPKGVAGLTGLTRLDLSRCESLQALPEGVASLTGLTSLDLRWCKSLQALPEGVAGLTGLRL